MAVCRQRECLMTVNKATTPPSARSTPQVAIIGSGIAGVSAASTLALGHPESANAITLYEIGRGPGGRAATRKTRAIPALGINHGAPYADISTQQGQARLQTLGAATRPYRGKRVIIDGQSGQARARASSADETLITGPDGEMANIAGAMLKDVHGALLPGITTAYSSMVRGITRDGGGDGQWVLSDKDSQEIGRADWLVVAGSGIAHPRWSATFGGEPPLVLAAAMLNDPMLDAALATIAQQSAAPVLTVLMYATDEVAAQWRELGFHDGLIENHPVLAKVSIQPGDQSQCAVVLHSTIDYARENAGVYGSSSSAARIGDASSDSTREEILIDEMLSALASIPAMPRIEKSRYAFGPLLHRWGNAFPEGPALPADLAVCSHARVAFCGDYVRTAARMGSYECAWLSGIRAGEQIGQS